MKKLLLLLAPYLFLLPNAHAQLALQDFEGTTGTALPTGWTQTNAGTGTFVGWNTGTNLTLSSSFFAPTAHTRFVAVNDNAAGANGNNSNDLLKSPVFSLATITHPFLSYDVYYLAASSATIHESLTVEISTNGGTSFTVVYTDPGITTNSWTMRQVDLTAYAGMNNIVVGFRYGDNNQWLNGAALDNIKVDQGAAAELGLIKIVPNNSTPTNYATINTTLPIGGTVVNNGYASVTSFTVRYQLASNAVVSDTKTGLSIAPFGTYDFTVATPLMMPAAPGNYPVKMWVEIAGDANHANDTLNTTVNATAFMPAKKIAFESSIGTACGNCVRGIVFMDSLWKTYPNNVSIVNVHQADPMTVSAYDTYLMQLPGYAGAPMVSVDRREMHDPQDVIAIFQSQYNYFGFASLFFGNATTTATSLSLPVTVKPAIDLNGDYRLMLTLTEDQVNGTASGYEQANAYSNADYGNLIPLSEPGYDFLNLPGTIPASQMFYNFVARNVVPSPTGAAGSLPASMTNNTNYSYTFNTTIDPSWKNLRAVVLLIRNSDGQVLNSNFTTIQLSTAGVGISHPNTNIAQLVVFPNPARDEVSVRVGLKEKTDLLLTITDAMGRIVYRENFMNLTTDDHLLRVATNDFAAGVYYLSAKTAQGSNTVKLTIAR